MINPFSRRDDYLRVSLYGDDNHQKEKMVHQLVLTAFVGPKPVGMETRHRDGNRQNNRLDNLMWGSSSENNGHDKRLHGTLLLGEKTNSVRLTAEQVQTIRELHAAKSKVHWGVEKLAAQYGVHASTIRRVANGTWWKHVGTTK
jgi:hypothetical protein